MKILPAIVEQHASEAEFLWDTRVQAVKAPHYRWKDLFDLDDRLEANLEGLLLAQNAGWEICLQQLDPKFPGTLFTAFHTALVGGREAQCCLDHVESCADALVSALSYAPAPVEALALSWLVSAAPELRWLGIRTCVNRRCDPGARLASLVSDSDSRVRAGARARCGRGGHSHHRG